MQTNGKVRCIAVAVLALDVATVARRLDARAAAAALGTMRARLLCLRASGVVPVGEAGTLHESQRLGDRRLAQYSILLLETLHQSRGWSVAASADRLSASHLAPRECACSELHHTATAAALPAY